MAVISDVRFGGSNSTGAVDSVPTLVDNLLERGLDRARLGMVGPVSHQYYTRLQAALPDVEWVDFSNKLRDQRQIKSVEEIERFKISAALSDASVAALAAQARPGITEHELARIVENAYLGEGGVNAIHFMITTPMDAPRGGVPQQYLTDRVLQSGDVLVTEISTNYWGYSAQILRTFAIDAEPTPAYQKLHDVALEAFYRIAAVIKDGTGIEEILDAAESVAEHGFTIYDDLLHGANQLPPILRTRQTYRGAPPQFQFRENMCLVIQPNVVTADGLMGVQVGDMLRVTKTGLEPLHTYPRELIVCRAGTSTQAY
jgi:Xaa-Pro aminopeptidase